MLAGLDDEVFGGAEPPGVVRVGPDIRLAVEAERLEAGGEGLGRPGAELQREHVEALVAEAAAWPGAGR